MMQLVHVFILILLDNSSPLMSDLYNWLSPVKELVAGEGVAKVIVSMVNVVKEKIPSISCNKPGKAGFPITTAIKLLLAYITPPREAKGGSYRLSFMQSYLIRSSFFFPLFFLKS